MHFPSSSLVLLKNKKVNGKKKRNPEKNNSSDDEVPITAFTWKNQTLRVQNETRKDLAYTYRTMNRYYWIQLANASTARYQGESRDAPSNGIIENPSTKSSLKNAKCKPSVSLRMLADSCKKFRWPHIVPWKKFQTRICTFRLSSNWKWSCLRIASKLGKISWSSFCFQVSPFTLKNHDTWGDIGA